MPKILDYLGFAKASRKLLYGKQILENLAKVELVFLASDLSQKSKERFVKKCQSYQITYLDNFDSESISSAIGKSVKTVALSDKGLAQAIIKEREREVSDA